ncbi:MAG TPA: ergothioneine biosynthesis protein EgtB [Ignavibacteriaceae bacterium]|nr:ergothioneine biosynthesis protein EgtB [Ignavibacteriaceae bacterium]
MKAGNGIISKDTKKQNKDLRTEITNRYKSVRNFTEELCNPLVIEDYVVQTMPDVSPAKWHLAHVAWFFETFVLRESKKDYKDFHPMYNFIFNSYYVQVGPRHTRAHRGHLTRPTVKDIYEFREYVDSNMLDFINNCDEETFEKIVSIIEIGLNHEQQHQELMLTDIKHVFSVNQLHPVYSEKEFPVIEKIPELKWKKFNEGIYEIGHDRESFCYDNETPVHKEFLKPFEIGSRLVTNKDYLEFIEDGGYKKTPLWLSDGWATLEREGWEAPMYWEKKDGEWWNFKLTGFKKVNPNEPVCHVSFYEADAFARWAGYRLPTEAEWEVASSNIPAKGNFVEERIFHPIALKHSSGQELQQIFGDVWEWTGSSYLPYPGYKPLPGALGEYNGKFMSGQMVLRGGSCATSSTHIRKTYRNFFYPDSRWQFMGLRLARDI